MKQRKVTTPQSHGFLARLRRFRDGQHRVRNDRPTEDQDFLRKYADARMDQPRMWL